MYNRRFKDDDLIKTDTAADENFISVFEMSPLKVSDSGLYGCRAVSEAGKKFSQFVVVTVNQGNSKRRRKRGEYS